MKVSAVTLFFLLTLTAEVAAQQSVATVQQPASAKSAKNTNQPSGAQGLGLGNHNTNAPIDITSNSFDYDLNNKIGTYSGNVIVVQGDMKMRADKMKVNVAQGKPTHIEATGKVVVAAPNGIATGDTGEYELASRTITMTGNVVLTKEKDVMRGSKLVMDMNTNVAHLYAQGLPGGRVRGLFVQEKDKQNKDKASRRESDTSKKADAGSSAEQVSPPAKSAGTPEK